MKLKKVPISKLKPNSWNFNVMSKEEMKFLVESLQSSGYAKPIIVYPQEKYYIIIDGEHRYRALKKLKVKEVEVLVIDDIPQEKAVEYTTILNIFRPEAIKLYEKKSKKQKTKKNKIEYVQLKSSDFNIKITDKSVIKNFKNNLEKIYMIIQKLQNTLI